ncbi:MAG: formylglycine-generating enzyme family protein [Lysobacter sp.]
MHRKLRTSSVSLLVAMLLPACAALAESPEQVLTDGIYPDVIEHPMPDDLSQFTQPASLVADLKAIQEGSLEERLAALADKSRRDQIFVEGGTFQMGDFGRLQSEEKLPWDSRSHSSPLHEVTLDSYSISKYKVTLAEFDLYAEANDVPSVQTEDIYTKSVAGMPRYRTPDKPAGTTWPQAKAYCQWLGELTKLPFDLPTEAQWEYAARDRGRFIVYPTNNGKLEWNVNVPGSKLGDAVNGSLWGSSPLAIALFPPSPIGMYDLAINSMDWVQDWYAADYYTVSATENPTGPTTGTEKVQRSWPTSNSGAAKTMSRRSKTPEPAADKDQSTYLFGFRCAVQSPDQIKSL